MKKKYNTEEERNEAQRERCRRWRENHPEYYQNNKEKIILRVKEWRNDNAEEAKEKRHKRYEDNKEKILKVYAEYRSTKGGRAHNLVGLYKKEDKEHKRGECTLTAEWILEHIFSGQCCTHCGETDWHKLGCNRLDNSKPHTIENVEPCCLDCNRHLNTKERSKKVLQYTLDGEFVREWESTMECGRNGFKQQTISDCCRGVRKTHKGYIWRYKEEVA